LRFCAPSIGIARTAVEPAEIHDVQICPGERLLLLLSSANFDAERFEEPERVDVERTPNPHLSFGFGAHRCLGAELATAELEIAVGELMRRFPDFAVTRDGVESYRTIPLVNGYVSVPITFAPAPRESATVSALPVLTAPPLRPAN
jgi:cytochrome P450